MHSLLFPTIVIDNFLDQPLEYVKLANQLEYKKDPKGHWPGTRSEDLSLLYPNMINRITSNIFSLFYNYSYDEVTWFTSSYFQKVSSNYQSGWVHSDESSMLTSIIYLCDSGLGTSIFKPRDIKQFYNFLHPKEKSESLKNENRIDDFRKFREENNSLFKKTISVDSEFNRLLCFEGENFHGVDNFISEVDEERLTLILFIKKVKTNRFPIQKSKQIF